MISKFNKYVIVLLLIGITAYLVKIFKFPVFNHAVSTNIFDKMPMDIGEWKGSRSVISDKVYKILETDAVFVSRYRNGKESVTLSIVYYPQLKVDFHKPEYCNVGRGDIIENLGERKILIYQRGGNDSISANMFLVRRDNGKVDLFCYYYKTGNYISGSYFLMRYNMVKRYFAEKKSDAYLTIISVDSINNIEETMNVIDKFIITIMPVFDKLIPLS